MFNWEGQWWAASSDVLTSTVTQLQRSFNCSGMRWTKEWKKFGNSFKTFEKTPGEPKVFKVINGFFGESILTPFCSFHKPICIFSNDLQCKMWWKPLKMSPNFWPLLYVYMLIMVKMCFCQKLSSLQVLVFLCLENKWALTSNSYWA